MSNGYLVVFDCDGTLVDSHGMIVECVNHGVERLGYPPLSHGAIGRSSGMPMRDMLMAEIDGLTHAIADEMIDHFRGKYYPLRDSADYVEPFFDGIHELLSDLRNRSIAMAVATGKREEGLKATLRKLDVLDWFQSLQYTEEGHVPGKPAPDLVLEAMRETGAAPEQTVMIGDAPADILMARNAGVRSVGVAWGSCPQDMLRDAGADHIAATPQDLQTYLNEFIR